VVPGLAYPKVVSHPLPVLAEDHPEQGGTDTAGGGPSSFRRPDRPHHTL
jgi:hypothetical protein